MRFQDSTGGMSTSNGVGVQFPDYLQNPRAGQSGTSGGGNQQSAADRNRAAFAQSIGLGNVVGPDGRPDYGKVLGAAKSFCV